MIRNRSHLGVFDEAHRPWVSHSLDGGSAMQQGNRLWRRSGLGVFAAVVALSLGACASSTNNSGASATVKAGTPLVIGASVSLTGDFADSGKAVQRGYQLWASQVNAKGGILGHKEIGRASGRE